MPLRIEEWSIVAVTPYAAPEEGARIYGRAYGRPNTEDGTWVTTSVVRCVKNGIVYVYSGKQYQLGEPSPEYEKQFPNAKERALASLTEE